MKQLPFTVLKECPCVGTFLYSLSVPLGYGRRAGFDMNHISSQGTLVAVSLGGAGVEMEGLEPQPGASWLLHVQWLSLPCLRVSRAQGAGPEALRVESRRVPFLLNVHSLPRIQHLCPGGELLRSKRS